MKFVCVRDFAGVPNGRAESSPFERFADANRHAMKRAAELDRCVKVFAVSDRGGWPQHIVTYARGETGSAIMISAGDQELARAFAEMECPDQFWSTAKESDGIWRQTFAEPGFAERPWTRWPWRLRNG